MTNLFWISHSKFFCFTRIVGFSYCATIFFSSWIYFTREYLIYLHVSPVLKFVSFLEVGMLGFYFDPKGPLPVTFLKNRGMDLWPKRPFSTYQTKLPRYTPKKQTKREIKKQQLHFTVVTQRFVILRPWNWACKRRFSYAWSIIRSLAKDRNNCCCRRKINLLNWQNSKNFCRPMTRNDDTWVP